MPALNKLSPKVRSCGSEKTMAQTVFSQDRTVAHYFVLSFQEEIEFLTHRAPRISPEWYQFAALKVSSKSVNENLKGATANMILIRDQILKPYL